MSLLYAFLKCLSNCFKRLRKFILFFIFFISLVCSLRFFFKNKFYFVFKIIYLSIRFSYVGLDVKLDCDKKNTILIFSKRLLYFSPLWNCTLGFFFFFFKEKELQSFIYLFFWIVFLLSFIKFLDKFLGVFDCMVEKF